MWEMLPDGKLGLQLGWGPPLLLNPGNWNNTGITHRRLLRRNYVNGCSAWIGSWGLPLRLFFKFWVVQCFILSLHCENTSPQLLLQSYQCYRIQQMKLLLIRMLAVNLKKQKSKEKENGVIPASFHLQIRNFENLQGRTGELKLELELKPWKNGHPQ